MAEEINILMVDDEEYSRRAIRRLFRIGDSDTAFRILEAAGGEAAMVLLAQQPVDCILLDVEMPGGSGPEWMPQMMAQQPHAAIIMVTGVHDEEIAVQAMKKGALDYLTKGAISPWSLRQAITSAVEKTRMRREIEQQREQLLVAERQRVMIESLGSACHHLGQPVSVITMCIELIRRQPHAPELQDTLEQCRQAVEAVHEILRTLQGACFYGTEPYLAPGRGAAAGGEDRILALAAISRGLP